MEIGMPWIKFQRMIDFSNASVSIGKGSAEQLGFQWVPKLTLLSFLRMIACNDREKNGKWPAPGLDDTRLN